MPAEVVEIALAQHVVGESGMPLRPTDRRENLFNKRRQLMTQWAAYLNTPPARGCWRSGARGLDPQRDGRGHLAFRHRPLGRLLAQLCDAPKPRYLVEWC